MKKTLGLTLLIFCNSVFAVESAAKEDTTPPAAEGPITPQQIPPLNSIENRQFSSPTPAAPAQQQAPATTNMPNTMQPSSTSNGQQLQPVPQQPAGMMPTQNNLPEQRFLQSPSSQPSTAPSTSATPNQYNLPPSTTQPNQAQPTSPLSMREQSFSDTGSHVADSIPESEILN